MPTIKDQVKEILLISQNVNQTLLERELKRINTIKNKTTKEQERQKLCDSLDLLPLSQEEFEEIFIEVPDYKITAKALRENLIKLYPKDPCLYNQVFSYALQNKIIHTTKKSRTQYFFDYMIRPTPIDRDLYKTLR